MIHETKEQLLKELETSWNFLLKVDSYLEDAIEGLDKMRRNIRNLRRGPHDETPVYRAGRVDASSGVGTGSSTQAPVVPRVPVTPGE